MYDIHCMCITHCVTYSRFVRDKSSLIMGFIMYSSCVCYWI